MKLQSRFLRTSLLVSVVIVTSSYMPLRAWAQQESDADSDGATAAKFPAAKRRVQPSPHAASTASTSGKQTKNQQRQDSVSEIRKRDEWFYKQRSSANGHIPAGARARALQHMQRMMLAEGKLVQRPDGSYAEVAPQFRAAPLVPVTSTWNPIGPTPTTGGIYSPVTGRITTIAVDPSDATGNTVLLGGAQGGIWRTTDGGTTWAVVGDQNASLALGSIAFAPSACSPLPGTCTVYAGTGEQASIGFDIYYGAGVLKSTDHGQAWTQTCTIPSATCPFIGPYDNSTPFGFFTLGGTRISYVAVNPSNPSMVLAAAQTQFGHGATEGVYCSADGGATWNIVSSASGEMATFVGFASSTVAFAALGNPFNNATMNGVYKSTNASSCSLTFSALSGGLPASSAMGRIDIGISPLFASDSTLYASIADVSTQSSTNLGVFVSTDGGTSWTKTTAPDICQQQCWYDNVIKVDPNGRNFAFFGGSSVADPTGTQPGYVIRTTNGGTSWSTVIPNLLPGSAGLPHVDNHAIAFVKLSTGVRMYLGNDGGIWRTDDAESTTLPLTWMNLNDSLLTLTQFYPALSIHPSSQGIAFAGAQDNGSQIYDQAVNGTAWTDNNTCGDGTGTAIDNVIPSTVFVACNGDNVAVSVTNGVASSYAPAGNGINLADNANFVPPMVTDPGAANTAYLGTTKVYQTVNAGTNWTALSGDLVNGARFDSLTALGVAPMSSASSVVYAGADTGQVFVATNVTAGTGTFNAVAGQTGLPSRQVSAIVVDPADPTGKTAYAAFSGFSFVQGSTNDAKGHLFKTSDGGTTWTDVSCTVANCSSPAATDLPNTPVNDVVIDPDIAGTLYVGTDIGVFQGTCTTTAPATCTWTTLSIGLPRVAVLSLKLHRASRTLRAATHGRGAWDIVLNNFTFVGPHISSISPVSALAGGAGFTLTVNGSGLTGGTVQWNGSTTNVMTTQVSDSQLTATIAASLIGGAGTPQVTVNVTATTSNALTFTVLGAAPTISNATPTSALVNAAATQITVTGTNFGSSSVIAMNPDVGGTAFLTPTSVTPTQLVATLPASFMANFGSTNSVGVQNPPPGGGTTLSNHGANPPVVLPTFTVMAPAPANDNFASAVNLTSTTLTDTKDSSGATSQTGDPLPPCSQIAGLPPTGTVNTIWYTVVPTGTGVANIDTIGSSYDSVLSVWSGTSQAALTVVGCNDDINPGIVTVSQIQNLTLTAGTTYYIMVSSFGALDPNPVAFGGKSVLNFSFTGTIGGGTGSFTVSGAAVTVAAGSNGTSPITVTPSGGFTGAVNVTCPAANLPPGVTCSPNPLAINVTSASPVAQNLTVAVAAPSPTTTASVLPAKRTVYAGLAPTLGNGKGWWGLSAITGLAAILLLLLPGRKRYRAAFALGLVCVLSFTLGCGSGYGGGGGGTATTTTSISASTKVASGTTVAVTATVTSTGKAATGQVQLYDGTNTLGTPTSVSNGSATVNATGLSVGTHAISAHYLGDTYTQASQSGTLNIAVTGSTTVGITGTSGSTTANGTINLTIN